METTRVLQGPDRWKEFDALSARLPEGYEVRTIGCSTSSEGVPELYIEFGIKPMTPKGVVYCERCGQQLPLVPLHDATK